MNAEDEARARLEVAQLYVEMGQLPKAARYYIQAAEIFLNAQLAAKARELLLKVLDFDPGNAQAESMLASLAGNPTVTGQRAPTAPAPVAPPPVSTPPPEAAPTAGGPEFELPANATLLVPTPCLFLRRDQQTAVMSQVTQAPDPAKLRWDPLPRIDEAALAQRAADRKKRQEEERMASRTIVESAFGSDSIDFSSGEGGLLSAAQRGSTRRKKRDKGDDKKKKRRRSGGGGRGGSSALADAIQRKIQNS